MTMQGSQHYYLPRQNSNSNAQDQGQIGHLTAQPPGYRPANSNFSSIGPLGHKQAQTHARPNNGCAQGFGMSEPGKKKRGRPRKYGPDGAGGSGSGSGSGFGSESMELVLSPSSVNLSNSGERKKRGRPPGSGRKQRLASLGEWMNNSAGVAFMPHVIHVQPGEDIAGKILSFAQQRPRAICIMSGSGGVSAVTLRQPASSGGTVTFEGRFEILCLSGSYLVTAGSDNRTGGVNVSLSSPDGHVIGGAVGGRLVASKLVQVVVCSFIYGSIKGKGKETDEKDGNSSEQPLSDKTSVQVNASPTQNVTGSWPGPKVQDSKTPSPDIDLANG